jgi:hypothetical protein
VDLASPAWDNIANGRLPALASLLISIKDRPVGGFVLWRGGQSRRVAGWGVRSRL